MSARRLRFAPGLLLVSVLASSPAGASNIAASSREAAQRERLTKVHVPFVENCGQMDPRVEFSAQTFFGAVFVTHDGKLVYSLPNNGSDGWSLTETFLSGRPRPSAGPRSGIGVSVFHGSDPTRWQSGVPAYEDILLGEVWPGIYVTLRAHGGNVEKVFTLGPGARTDRIRLRMDGSRRLRVDRDGSLVAATGVGDVLLSAPAAYQEFDGVRRSVSAAYVVRGSTYGFRLGQHDPTLPVVVDPVLQSTYLGGTGFDLITAVAADPSTGEVLVAGCTLSTDFPGTVGGVQPVPGGTDAFVARLDPALTTLRQATYLGGPGVEVAYSLAVDPSTRDVLVVGYSWSASSDFPGTSGGAQAMAAGYIDGFVARLDSELTTLRQASYLGGTQGDWAMAVAIHPTSGEVLVAGGTTSVDFPVTPGGAQTLCDAIGNGFVARLDPALTTVLQSTCLGGSAGEIVYAMAVDPMSREVLVAGNTSSSDFPKTAGGAQPAAGGGETDGFVARLNPTLTTLLQATYLGGGGGELMAGIAVHPASDEILVAGSTGSTNLPGTSGGAQPGFAGGLFDGFVARLDRTLTTLRQATYLGTSPDDWVNGIAVHPSGDVFVTGGTESSQFPKTAGGSQPVFGGPSQDGFVARFDAALTSLRQATYLGGGDYDAPFSIAMQPTGNVVVAGYTYSQDFPGTPAGAQTAYGGDRDGFVARLTPDLKLAPPCIADGSTLCLGHDRFRVRVSWSAPSRGLGGAGAAIPLSDDTGYFWFFDGDNVELVVKVLDGRTINGSYWVFYGALSDVQYTITVTDNFTGEIRNYENAAGTLASIADTSAFTDGGAAVDLPGPGSTRAFETRSAASCVAGGTTLCLNQSRFQVTVDWEVPAQARSGHGTAVPMTSDTGYFWFFDGGNVELVVKVLDGRSVNGHVWVFYGALSDVQYRITVTDTETQAVRTYVNQSGTLASVADTAAF